jgi:hypothetical protein
LRLLGRSPPLGVYHQSLDETKRGLYLRKFARWMSGCALLPFAFASFAHSQQFDFAVGGGTLFSTKNITASQAYPAPAEKGGVFPSVSIERVFKNHYGYSAEFAFRFDQGLYNDYQKFRPVIYDVNAVYNYRLAKKFTADMQAGLGGQSTLFYSPIGNCVYSACSTHLDSNRFLLHAGFGLRYALFHRLFVRPEANYYRIINNTVDFHSDNVLRLGASVGYTFPRD